MISQPHLWGRRSKLLLFAAMKPEARILILLLAINVSFLIGCHRQSDNSFSPVIPKEPAAIFMEMRKYQAQLTDAIADKRWNDAVIKLGALRQELNALPGRIPVDKKSSIQNVTNKILVSFDRIQRDLASRNPEQAKNEADELVPEFNELSDKLFLVAPSRSGQAF